MKTNVIVLSAFLCTAIALSGCSQKNNPTAPGININDSVQYESQTWKPSDCLLSEEFIGTPGTTINGWYGAPDYIEPVYGSEGNSARIRTTEGADFSVIAKDISHADLRYHNRLRMLVNKVTPNTAYTVIVKAQLFCGDFYIQQLVGNDYSDRLGYVDVRIPWLLRLFGTNSIVVQIQMDYTSPDAYVEIGEIYIYRAQNDGVYWEDQFGNGDATHPEGWWDAITYNESYDSQGKDFNADLKRTASDTATIELLDGGLDKWGKVMSPPVKPYALFDKLSIDILEVNESTYSFWKIVLRETTGAYREWDLTGLDTVSGVTHTYDLSGLTDFFTAEEVAVEIIIVNTDATPYLTFDNIKYHH